MVEIPDSTRATIVFHNAEPSESVHSRAQYYIAKLLQFHPTVMHCTMTIEGRHRHHHQGNIYHVSLRIHLPGGDIVVSQDPERDHAHEDVYVSMRDACDAARRQLGSFLDKRRGHGARHEHKRFSNRPATEM
jgi:hypothetical protein